MARAATWPSLIEPSVMPATRSAISRSLRMLPSRLWRMSSANGLERVELIGAGSLGGGAKRPESLGTEGQRKELAERHREAHTLRPAEMDPRVRARELGQLLAAPPAGGAERRTLGHHDGLDDLPIAGRDHDADGRGLGALADRVGRVLDVAPRVEPAARGPEARTDAEARVRRVGAGERPTGQVEHLLQRLSQRCPSPCTMMRSLIRARFGAAVHP